MDYREGQVPARKDRGCGGATGELLKRSSMLCASSTRTLRSSSPVADRPANRSSAQPGIVPKRFSICRRRTVSPPFSSPSCRPSCRPSRRPRSYAGPKTLFSNEYRYKLASYAPPDPRCGFQQNHGRSALRLKPCSRWKPVMRLRSLAAPVCWYGTLGTIEPRAPCLS